jgi:hypothetical protein
MLQKVLSQVRLRYLSLSSRTVGKALTDEDRLALALVWFKNSILSTGGSAAKYSMMFNQLFPAYPETNGFWINTLIAAEKNYPALFKEVFDNRNITEEIVNWLLTTQRLDGTFPGSYGDYLNQPPRVFNNGQIILGLSDYYEQTKREDVLQACTKSADWLCSVQQPDGSWKQFTLHQLTSNTRTAWALLKMGKITSNKKYTDAGTRNLDYAVAMQLENGYLPDNGFDTWNIPTTHTIGYALRGLTGAGKEFANAKWIAAARKGYDAIVPLIKEDGFLKGELDEGFKSTAYYCCLTGNCQLSVIGFELFEITGEEKYKVAASRLINFVKEKQLVSDLPQTNGGISGSWPINGGYCAYDIPNWAVKFFADALMRQKMAEKSAL